MLSWYGNRQMSVVAEVLRQAVLQYCRCGCIHQALLSHCDCDCNGIHLSHVSLHDHAIMPRSLAIVHGFDESAQANINLGF